MIQQRLYTIQEVAQALGVEVSEIQKRINLNQIPIFKDFQIVRITQSTLDLLLREKESKER